MAYTRRSTDKDAIWQRAWTADTPADLASIPAVHGDVAFVTSTAEWRQWFDDGTWQTLSGITAFPISVCDGRLTTESGVPISTSDRTDQATLYWTPFNGNRVALYNGTTWDVLVFAELSHGVEATSGKPYDVFLYNNSGVVALETLVWSTATARATALTLQDGILVKSGATTRRYVGTYYPYAASKVMDTARQRHLWNYYHRIRRPLRVLEATDSWVYSTSTIRQARATSTNQVEIINGFVEESIALDVIATWTAGATATVEQDSGVVLIGDPSI